MTNAPPGQGGASGNQRRNDAAEPIASAARSQEREPFTIVLQAEPFGLGYDVLVVPPPFGVGHDREFPAYEVALTYAGELARVTGWQLRDLAGG